MSQRTMLEDALGKLDIPITFLRSGWFMENAALDIASARDEGVLHSFPQPAEKAFAMMATQDVSRLAADLIREAWTGKRVVELEGSMRVSPNDLAEAFATVLGHAVRLEIFRAKAGRTCSVPRVRVTRIRASACSTALTRAG
ncbi:hypothetical protein [Shinella sp.]|uniref:hypothetical protein n=1 Tax=Shinella sp. TaxID=1870904 RepID=UPI003F72344F